MTQYEGIHGFFSHLDIEAHYFDLGRRITPLATDAFIASDQLLTPYPTPYLQHAWLGVLFWQQGEPQNPMVWTLKLPLDERNLFEPAARDLFLRQLLTTMGKNVEAAKRGENMQAVLDNNPYSFTLPQERQAVFHAKASVLLERQPSRFYQPTLNYLANPTASAWQELSIQGLADVCARWPQHISLLANALPAVPGECFIALCQLLEHEELDAKLVSTIGDRLDACLAAKQQNPMEIAAAIRGMSFSPAVALRRQKLEKTLALLQQPNVEVIAAIASRCSHDLSNPELALAYLELLATLGQANFNQVITDLFSLEELKGPLRTAFRHPQRSTQLIHAIGELLAAANQTPQ